MNSIDQFRDQVANVGPDQFVARLLDYIKEKGQSRYDESVTQIEHALQCAQLAKNAQLPATAVTAALLHDLGHLLLDEHDSQEGFLAEDLNHEEIGAKFLTDFFPPVVTEPIRLHVAAKRYLCSTDKEYYDKLSEASKRSFAVQGGNLSAEEQSEFEKNEHLNLATKIRRLDDQAKKKGLPVPDIEEFASQIAESLQRGSV